MGHVARWREAGERAASRGEPEEACPYRPGSHARRHWHDGWCAEMDRMEEWLRDMNDLQKQERR